MKVITLPCFNIVVQLGGDDDIFAEWPVPNIKEGDVAWQDSYRNALIGLEWLILHHAKNGVDVKDDKYVEGLKGAVAEIQEMYQVASMHDGSDFGELPEKGVFACGNFVTAKDLAAKFMHEGKEFSFRSDENKYVLEVEETQDEHRGSGEDSN